MSPPKAAAKSRRLSAKAAVLLFPFAVLLADSVLSISLSLLLFCTTPIACDGVSNILPPPQISKIMTDTFLGIE